MLIGSYSGILSPKRRTAIPKRFLDELGKKVIIAKWYEGCLVIVGTDAWEALLDRLSGRIGLITGPVRDTERFILGSAYELIPDRQGRVVIPTRLVAYAALTQEIVFIGLGERVEIWGLEKWAEREKFVAAHAAEFIEKLAQKNDKR